MINDETPRSEPISIDELGAEAPEQWRMAGMLAPICADDAPELVVGMAVRLESSYGRAMWQRIVPIPESRIGVPFDARNPPT